ncbi:MAG: MBL fold metallo-hydrolase [Clostridia bacterium]|nr:MBL fold metallo-hydrolase [Clostridia bacterium]
MADKNTVVKKIKDNLYVLTERSASGFLLIGEEKACMIDTMFGFTYSMEDIRKLTDKPIIVINTHGHGDHVLGNINFEKAYLHPDDRELAEKTLKQYRWLGGPKRFRRTWPVFEEIHEGDIVDLGGLELKVYELPGHTKGGIVLLCPQLRILFTGDGINHYLFMFLKDSISIKEYLTNLKRLEFLENEADYILHGHGDSLNDISLIKYEIKGAEEILNGDTKNDEKVRIMGMQAFKHSYKADESKQFDSDGHYIFYSDKKIN